MKKILFLLGLLLIPSITFGANVTVPQSTAYGQVLIGNATGGNYTPVATSTLNITSPFATTSADYWISTYDKGYFFSTTSSDYWKTQRNFWSTTSADYWGASKSYISSVSGTFPIKVTAGTAISFDGLSTSTPAVVGNIPYFSGVNTFANVSTTTASCSGSASCTPFTVIGSSPVTISATGGGGSAYPFPDAGNATSTLTQFNGGLTAYASSTISSLTVTNGTTTNATTTNLYASATSTFAVGLKTDHIAAVDSSGLDIYSNSGASIALLGAGGTSGATFYGGVNTNGALNVLSALTTLANLQVNSSTTLQNFTALNATTSQATSTNLYTSGQTVLAALGGNVGIGVTNPSTKLETNGTASSSALVVSTLTGLLKGNGTSAVTVGANGTDYTLVSAQTCTNQVITALTASGGSTCSTVANAMLANSTISGIALGGNLASLTHDTTLSGTSYNGSTAISDWSINLASGNVWTAASTTFTGNFNITGNSTTTNATTTNFFATTASTTNFFASIVGIGTSSPDDILEVRSNSATKASFAAYNNAGTNIFKVQDAGILFTNATGTNATTTAFAITSLGTPAGTFLAVNPNGSVIATTTPSGSSSITNYFASSTTGYVATQSISVTPGKKYVVWGKGNVSSNSGGQSLLRVKQSTYSASTTLDLMNGSGGGNINISATLMGYFTATTTESIIFDINGFDDTTRIFAESLN